MSGGDSPNPLPNWTSVHDAVKPIQWLVGTWKSISADGSYPTIAPFTYCEEVTFLSLGQPLLTYNSVSWHPLKKSPMHMESGFLRIQPGTENLAFMVAHNFGLTTLEEGTLVDKHTIKLSSKEISRMSFAQNPQVTDIERTFELINDKLHLTVNMKTCNTELTQHLKVVYNKT